MSSKPAMATQGEPVSKKQNNKNPKPVLVLLIPCSRRISKTLTHSLRNLNKGQAKAHLLKRDILPVSFCARVAASGSGLRASLLNAHALWKHSAPGGVATCSWGNPV